MQLTFVSALKSINDNQFLHLFSNWKPNIEDIHGEKLRSSWLYFAFSSVQGNVIAVWIRSSVE